jgi:hypothetical protein
MTIMKVMCIRESDYPLTPGFQASDFSFPKGKIEIGGIYTAIRYVSEYGDFPAGFVLKEKPVFYRGTETAWAISRFIGAGE